MASCVFKSSARHSIAKSTLSGSRAKVLDVETLPNPLRPPQPVKTTGGKDNRLRLTLLQLAQPGIDVAAKLDVFKIGPQRAQLGLTSRAAATYLRIRPAAQKMN